jgi:hypothetical protein
LFLTACLFVLTSAVAIYNMALLALAYVVVKYALGSSMSALGLLRLEWTLKSLVILMSIGIIFGPKFRIIIWKNDLEEKYERRAAAASSTIDSGSGAGSSTLGRSSSGTWSCLNIQGRLPSISLFFFTCTACIL